MPDHAPHRTCLGLTKPTGALSASTGNDTSGPGECICAVEEVFDPASGGGLRCGSGRALRVTAMQHSTATATAHPAMMAPVAEEPPEGSDAAVGGTTSDCEVTIGGARIPALRRRCNSASGAYGSAERASAFKGVQAATWRARADSGAPSTSCRAQRRERARSHHYLRTIGSGAMGAAPQKIAARPASRRSPRPQP